MKSISPGVRAIALVVAATMFMAQLDGAVLATALPRIGAAFGVSPIRLSTSITVYLMTFVAMLPASGWIAERFGPRQVFVLATGVFTLGSIFCAASVGYDSFIAARVVQAVGASLMTPVGRLVLLRAVPREEFISAMTITTVPMLLAPTFGPALGGFVITYFSWGWIFLINVPVGVAAMICAWRMIPPLPGDPGRGLDLVGMILVSGALLALLVGLDQLGAGGVRVALMLLAGGSVGLGVAWRHLGRHPHPVLSLAPFRNATFSISGLSGGGLVRLPIRALPFLLPLLFQLQFGMSPLVAGMMLIALNGGDLALKFITGPCFRRFGFRNVLVVNGMISAVALALCGMFGPRTPVAAMLAVLVVSGFARSLLLTGLSSLAFVELPENELGSANSLMSMTLQLTSSAGVSLSVLLLRLSGWWRGGGGGVSLADYHFALLAMAGLAVLAALWLLRLAPEAGAGVSGHRAR